MSEATKKFSTMSMTLSHFQREFVDQITQAIPPARFLLSAPPGAGKTMALVSATSALHTKRSDMRCLMIAPKALAGLWVDQMTVNAGISALEINPQTYRRLQAESGSDVNVWANISCAVASPEFLSIADRIEEVLEAGWDLVILDEAHRFTQFTKQGGIAEKIWSCPAVKIAVAASSTPDAFEWIAAEPGTTRIRWSLPELMKDLGVPERHVQAIQYEPSIPEQHIAVLVDELVRQMSDDKVSKTAAIQILSRMESSLYALEQTLRRLLTVEYFGDTDLCDWTTEELFPENDAIVGANLVRVKRQSIEQILDIFEAYPPSDSKWECCHHLLEVHEIGRTRSGIIFTDYADTAEYLEFMARSRDLKTLLLTGESSVSQMSQAVEKATGSPTLVIATGAIEGVNLAFTDRVLHYDLPSNPERLLQRMGRIERVTNQFKTINHYLIQKQGGDTEMTSRILEKLSAIEKDWM